ncbi:MAG TPA: MAPEG family protein [Steroidobacteraceae bacterium]|nr:MAPEG family protein [Gammaproteobacteria bacterium]HEV2286039.1 MAPEG family protein [Steroidobacteraceae bacterium]
MALVHFVLALALLEFFAFGYAVARARGTYKVAAPATTGHEVFERYFRVQMNTLEQLVVFGPSLMLFAWYVNAWIAAALGLLFVIGRALYFRGYVRSAEGRHLGFLLSAIPNVTLLVGGLLGAAQAFIRSAF